MQNATFHAPEHPHTKEPTPEQIHTWARDYARAQIEYLLQVFPDLRAEFAGVPHDEAGQRAQRAYRHALHIENGGSGHGKRNGVHWTSTPEGRAKLSRAIKRGLRKRRLLQRGEL